MQRLTDDRGAVGVVVALLMVPLIGFAAISIDVAAMWTERQELQTGADAAALAVAQDCARGSCGDAAGTAQELASANAGDGDVTARVSSAGAGSVSVTTAGVREHFFAPVLGIDSSTITTTASAGWGAPTRGTAELPLAISWCDFQAQTGGGAPTGSTTATIVLTEPPAVLPPPAQPGVTNSPAPTPVPADPSAAAPAQPEVDRAAAGTDTTCAGPRGSTVTAGFGWLAGSAGCRTASSIAAGAQGSSGGLPEGCSAAELSSLQGRTMLIPIFASDAGPGAAAGYDVYGYAAFTLTGYNFAGRFGWRNPCGGGESCISGSFTQWADLSDHFDHDDAAPQLGAAVVSLTR